MMGEHKTSEQTDRRYITRMDYSRSTGWWVRIYHSDPTPGVPRIAVSKFFRDTFWGGVDAALEAARRWRDEMLVEYPRFRGRNLSAEPWP